MFLDFERFSVAADTNYFSCGFFDVRFDASLMMDFILKLLINENFF